MQGVGSRTEALSRRNAGFVVIEYESMVIESFMNYYGSGEITMAPNQMRPRDALSARFGRPETEHLTQRGAYCTNFLMDP